MLEKMRNNSNSLIVKILLGVLALSFVGWGVGDFISGGYNTTAISVGDTQIDIQKVASEYNKNISRLKSRFGVDVTPEMAASMGLANRTVQNMIQDAIVDQMIAKIDLRVSDKQLSDVLFSTTAFLDSDGKFNKEIYKNTVRNAGMTVENYEKSLRTDLLRSTLIDLFNTPFDDQKTVERHLSFNQERMKIQTLEIDRSAIKKDITATDEEISAYYNEHTEDFNTEETRDIEVLYIDTAELAKKAEVTEAEIKEMFEADKEAYIVEEMRSLSHILLKSKEDAVRVRDMLDKNPADFERLAKVESKDVFTQKKGGKIGNSSRHDFEESFADTAFALELNQISEPVETSFGYHIIRVNSITPAYKKNFDQAKGEIESTLRAEKADDAYYTILETVEDRVAAGEALTSIATDLGLTLKSYPSTAFSTADFADAEFILPTAFEMTKGEVSAPLDMVGESKGVFFVQTTAITDSRPLTLAESHDTIKETVIAKKVSQKTAQMAADALNTRLEGKSMAQIAQMENLPKASVHTYTDINRNRENAPKWLTDLYMKELFVAPVGGVVNQIIPTSNGYAILELVDRQIPELTADMKAGFADALRNEMGQDLQHMFILSLIQNADIELNHKLLRNTLGDGYIPQ